MKLFKSPLVVGLPILTLFCFIFTKIGQLTCIPLWKATEKQCGETYFFIHTLSGLFTVLCLAVISFMVLGVTYMASKSIGETVIEESEKAFYKIKAKQYIKQEEKDRRGQLSEIKKNKGEVSVVRDGQDRWI